MFFTQNLKQDIGGDDPSYYHKNMSEIEFSTLAAKIRICLIFTDMYY